MATVTCPVSRSEFLRQASTKDMAEAFANDLRWTVKAFSSGSVGFYAGGKVDVTINGVQVRLQVTASAVMVNSQFMTDDNSVVGVKPDKSST